MTLPRTPTDIVSLIRAVNGSEFSLSGSEAELLVKLFASAAAVSDAAPISRQTSNLVPLKLTNEGRAA
jgi:hypothetical protein